MTDMLHGEIRWFRYVPNYRILAYLLSGNWKWSCDLGPIHGYHASMWEWIGKGLPRDPE